MLEPVLLQSELPEPELLELELAFEDGRQEMHVYSLPLLIGKGGDCQMQLRSWRVARHHARIARRGTAAYLEDLGSLAGTWANGRRIAEYGPLSAGDELIIGPCRIQVVRLPMPVQRQRSPVSDRELAESVVNLCRESSDGRMPTLVGSPSPIGEVTVSNQVQHTRHVHDRVTAADHNHDVPFGHGHESMRNEGQESLQQHLTHRRRLHKALLEALDLRRRDILSVSDEVLRTEASEALAALLQNDSQLPTDLDREDLLRQVVDEAIGLGPLEPLLADRSVTEIMVNSHEEIFVERAGRLLRHDRTFSSEQAVQAVIDRIVAPLGRRIDESSPMVDARLRDGSRVNAVIPPIALRGPCLTIRKFPERRLEMQDLLQVGSLDPHMANFLRACVRSRKNILVSGGTGSGKTTLLNVLSNCIPDGERIITIEDAAELRLNHVHLVALEARPANAEGKGRVEIRELVRNALRMRPDRIIVGECRGAEAFDMLSAMNTGHEGSLTTLHANSPRDALARLETMILMAGMDLPLAAIREHIASAVDFIVQQARLSSGHRLVTAIVEVTGMESGRIQTQELFRYRGGAVAGFEGCGVLPECFGADDEPIPMAWLTHTTLLTELTHGAPSSLA